ncbi:PAS domain-containing sensor histidine kinase [Paenibacillus filicis]|uniref:Oxygen sensor histidine kinase NreB n=1 Tax=Paenibacillus gyeongsangnamensis TaxID=3388067 RepID=A0ABT4Q9W2_9BACL|nr:PAS domain-containing sensor histidine kinase [Paenibacillus filicis]MCZ8513669.1 PAS domain-containing sensor histidine kinase [Paenibacillus filicis]
MTNELYQDAQRLRELFNLLNDGIIVMDQNRIIVYINPSATRITGWELGDVIPYCLYCQKRTVPQGEERCFLASQLTQSYFESELPTKMGTLVPVGMSRTFLSSTNNAYARNMVITIRDVTIERQTKELESRAQLNQRTLEVQEEERKRISQELHDSISQTLYAINLSLEHLKRHVPSQQTKIEEINKQVKLCSEEVRAMSRNLYPAVLYDLGLTAAIRTLGEQMSSNDRVIEVNIDADWLHDDLNRSAVHVYRIVQESLHNAILHGKASQILVSLSCDRVCFVTIEDNGQGFDTNFIKDTPGYGLKNMKERVSALNGKLNIISSPGHGTKVELQFPNPVIESRETKDDA